ncbi:hypothetical protein EYF88_15425 [Paracoccus sediminis]|uniref:Uncharacterized protein n=1 Tax=Paracoccus sediminis TaxID=1214787 RepID=A0A238Y4S7_9RHOB|nr:hypothetical protein [Paracoccus sediminis]TBN47219.1 hypothetical protein EYF88_15425 [Paracoccus sediminis]SNR65319.1 hypothetical protein SAMN06265378_11434 [Paracoccus sediminis]
MILFQAVIGLVVLWGVWTGATRLAARSLRPLLAAFAALLGGALACWLIGLRKTDYSGLAGTLLAFLLILTAGSVAFGAALRWIHDATRRRIPSDPEWPLTRPWDIWGLCGLSALAVIASLLA